LGSEIRNPSTLPFKERDTTSTSDLRPLTSDFRLPAAEGHCALCSLPVGRSGVETLVNGTVLRFCCSGCMAVFQILFNQPGGPPGDFTKTELYQACVASGLIPRTEEEAVARETEAPTGSQAPSSSPHIDEDDLALPLTIKLDGMWCPACGWLIEAVLRKTKGVVDASVFFLSDLATIKYLPHRTPPRNILSAVTRLGYRAALLEDQDEASPEKRGLLMRLGLSSILTANIMMISLALYAGFFHELGEDVIRYFSYPLWILATPVVFYGGFPIIRRALFGLRSWSFSMDTLIAVGALSAYFYSLAMMNKGSLHLYFDTAAMLVTLVLLGKYVEKEAREKASRGMRELCNISAGKVRLFGEKRETWIATANVSPGDEFLVLNGERIPLDGLILSGQANLDESFLSGESRPLKKSPGDSVLAGSLVLDGQLLLRATRTASESSISQMIALMHHTLNNKAPVELLADRITRWLTPAILFLAAGTVLYLRLQGVALDQALLRGLTVLVITCPCALGIATPLAKVAAIGIFRTNGMIIQNPGAFEKVKGLDTLIFDKTGTITEGKFLLKEVFSDRVGREEALRRVAAIEALSDHFLAKEIVRAARDLRLELEEAGGFESFEGLGIRGRLECGEVCAGNRRFMEGRGLVLAPSIDQHAGLVESKGMTSVFFGWDQEVQGFFTFGDSPKADAKRVVSELQEKGFELWLVSGDSLKTTRAIAQELGFQNYSGQALPKDKMDLVRKLQEKGQRVGMVGDGINDVPGLAQADVGIAFGSGANLIQDASDIAIFKKDLSKIPEILQLSALTTKVIKENLFFAFLYNHLGIPLAVGGVLNPLIAVLAMFASSLTVIGNTLRIARFQGTKELLHPHGDPSCQPVRIHE
jgi:heavy metal translocating P-type ATPase